MEYTAARAIPPAPMTRPAVFERTAFAGERPLRIHARMPIQSVFSPYSARTGPALLRVLDKIASSGMVPSAFSWRIGIKVLTAPIALAWLLREWVRLMTSTLNGRPTEAPANEGSCIKSRMSLKEFVE
ncbi:hypothetical protein RRF57_011291 [Xylaria bambusicola]|uniref:Uncharacterized protein n=1 Tax=Xylaria bambusicola TaxID=326684 RepID=A0AAN7V2I1_9PEZI